MNDPPALTLAGVELVRVDIPFRTRLGTAAGVHELRTLLFIRVVANEGEGWGECAALAGGTSVDPELATVERMAADTAIPRLARAAAARAGRLPSGPEVPQLFGTSPPDRVLAAAFEMAVADAELRAQGRSLAQSLQIGNGFESMPVGAVVGIPPGHDSAVLREEVDRAVATGAARVRLKIEPGWDIDPVRTVHAAHPDLALQVDANGSYRAADAVELLSPLAYFEVVCVEQPLPAADLVAHAQLATQLRLPICLDESLSSPRRVRDALRNGSCAIACLKPARLGGLRATRAAHAECAAAGVLAFVGGFFEAGLGRAANLALAARLGQDATGLVGDLGSPAEYLSVDPCGYPPVVDGWVMVPTEPGVGRWPDAAVLDRLGVRRRWFPATYT